MFAKIFFIALCVALASAQPGPIGPPPPPGGGGGGAAPTPPAGFTLIRYFETQDAFRDTDVFSNPDSTAQTFWLAKDVTGPVSGQLFRQDRTAFGLASPNLGRFSLLYKGTDAQMQANCNVNPTDLSITIDDALACFTHALWTTEIYDFDSVFADPSDPFVIEDLKIWDLYMPFTKQTLNDCNNAFRGLIPGAYSDQGVDPAIPSAKQNTVDPCTWSFFDVIEADTEGLGVAKMTWKNDPSPISVDNTSLMPSPTIYPLEPTESFPEDELFIHEKPIDNSIPFQCGYGGNGVNLAFGCSSWVTVSDDGETMWATGGDFVLEMIEVEQDLQVVDPPPPPSGCSQETLYDEDYAGIVFGDFQSGASGSVKTRLAAGNLFVSDWSVGDDLPEDNTDEYLIVRGINSGIKLDVRGIYQYVDGFGPIQPSVTAEGFDAVANDAALAFDFDTAEGDMLALSAAAAALPVNGITEKEFVGSRWHINLRGDCTGANVFHVEGIDVQIAAEMTLYIPQGSSVVINISGINVQFAHNFAFLGDFNDHIQRTVFNFYEADTVHLSNIGVTGSILAPQASLLGNAGDIFGQLISKNYNSMIVLHGAPFLGCITTGEDTCDVPDDDDLGTCIQNVNCEHGFCEADVCVCYTGYEGTFCETPIVTSNNASCTDTFDCNWMQFEKCISGSCGCELPFCAALTGGCEATAVYDFSTASYSCPSNE
eukprot:GFYU01000106.1.p1 GENE.GFYU01000106.1~~GFYU01000106.1.p1  ORF type:complete len:709 (+),score=284.64 GFYU01000106.1:170-2296(+)